jgi:hypothetical protein
MNRDRSHRQTPVPGQFSAERRQKFDKCLVAYALAAGGVVACAHPAAASIVFTKKNVTLTNGTLNIDLNNDGTADFTLHNYLTGSSSFYVQKLTVHGGADTSAQVIGQTQAGRLNAWDAPLSWSIGPNSPKGFINVKGVPALMASGVCLFQCYPHGAWGRATNKFLGFQFSVNGEVHYGWARLSVSLTNSGLSATLTGYAYETVPNMAILAGDRGPTTESTLESAPLPRSPSLGVLSLGAPGLNAWRREDS